MNQPNHGMLQHTNVNLNYSNPGNQPHPHQLHGHGSDPGDGNMEISSSPWGKCPSQHGEGMMNPEIHPVPGPPANSFGASSTFNHNHYSQQHCYYPTNHHELRYNNQVVSGSQIRDSAGYPNNNSAGAFYEDEHDCRQYYNPPMDHLHSGPFPYDQQNVKNNSCAMTQGGHHGPGGNSNNFYGYYNNQNSHYSNNGMYPQSGSGSDESDFLPRPHSHHNNLTNRYFDPNSSDRQIPPEIGVQGYFPPGYGPGPGPQPQVPQCGSGNNRYNSSSHSHYSHHHGHHPPFRRKSMESYIAEPGDLRYNSNSTKYGCTFSATQPQPQPNQQQPYCSPAPSPSSTSPMIKRECLSNPSSSMPVPLSTNTNTNTSCSAWSRNSSNSSASASDHDVHMQDPGQGHHSQGQEYLYPNSNSHLNQSSNTTYNNSTMSYQTTEIDTTFHQQINSVSSFKSCVFEHTEHKFDGEMKINSTISTSSFQVKAASVKHRSLSIPLPSSSSYTPNDIMALSHQNHDYGHRNDNCSTSTSNHGGDSNPPSCSDISEKVDESIHFVSTDSQEKFANNYDIPNVSPGESGEHISHQHQHQHHNQETTFNNTGQEECTVTSCDETNQNDLLTSTFDSGESEEKVQESNDIDGDCESGGESHNSNSESFNHNSKTCSPSQTENLNEDQDCEDMDSSLILDTSAFDDLPESDMIIAEEAEAEAEVEGEKSYEDIESEESQTSSGILLQNSHKDGNESESVQNDGDNPSNVNVISTTTTESHNDGDGGISGGLECDADSESNSSSNNSSCSFTSALFGIKRANSVSCNFGSSSGSDNESCNSASGVGVGLGPGLSFTINPNSNSNLGGGHCSKFAPQKISKRSFSETDKDMVVNATAFFGHGVTQVSSVGNGGVIIPKGWKREIAFSKDMVTVYYVSPSDTKLRSWDELKNYICSDGTCKCGLSCPLRLESIFNFDPKVISLCVDKKVKQDEDLMYLTGFKEEEDEVEDQQQAKSPLCNHYKRKIPKSEDSPLISSTRDDLGDCPEKRIKKRRTSESEFSTGNPGNATPNNKQESPLPSSVSRNVAVPCSQQSPDTTTQTPQTEMSPASSVCSEPSSGTNFGPAGGTRSHRSTPTPPSSTGKASTPPSKRQQGQAEFVWPQPPTTQTQPLHNSSKGNYNGSNAWTSPTTSTVSSNNVNNSNVNNNTRKSGPGCHHLIPKNKRGSSPCPNIDVRQIPLEQNRPPPKTGESTLGIGSMLYTTNSTNAAIPSATASNGAISSVTSHPGFNPNISFFPVTSTPSEMTNLSMNLNSGFTISPIVQPSNTMSILNPPLSQMLSGSNVSCTIPLEIQKVIGQEANPGTFLPQFQSPVVFSMIGQPQPQIQTLLTNAPKVEGQITLNNPVPVELNNSADSSAEKSPLQLVQDVVNRVEIKSEVEEGKQVKEEILPTPSTTDGESNIKTEDTKDVKLKVEGEESQSNLPKADSDGPTDSKEDIKLKSETGSKEISENTTTDSSSGTSDTPEKPDPNTSQPSKVDSITPAVNTSTVSLPPMDQSTVTTCVTSLGNTISTFTVPTSAPQQIILQAPQSSGDQSGTANFLSTANQQMRYPIIQTIQPFFLNPAGGTNGPLIISPQSQSHQSDQITQQSFIYHDPQQLQQGTDHGLQSMLQPTMLFDPSGLCANNPNLIAAVGGKKKKKRLSKKQQQQQAQLQLQQQLLIQQIQQAQQQQAAASFPLTIFPQSFNFTQGSQGFSLQPMNFFQTPTILTLPNLILNPADGTLFIQPSAPLSTTSVQQSTVKFPLTTTTTIQPQPGQGQQIQPHPNPIAPKKDGNGAVILEGGKALSDAGSDDLRRNNPTPDSSTGDIQLGVLNANTPSGPGNTIISIAPHPTTTILPVNKKPSMKSRAVSSSSTVKRIFQKQILPKIDSTTPSIENN